MAVTDLNITIDFASDFNTFVVGTNTDIKIFLRRSDDSVTDVTNSVETSIFSLDETTLVFDVSTDKLYFKNEGSGRMKAIYKSPSGRTLVAVQEFVSYDTFFKDNYKNHLLSTFDKDRLGKKTNVLARIIMDTTMEMLDIFYAYVKDTDVLLSFSESKSKFLDVLATNVGFERIDLESIDTSDEQKTNTVFRELLENIMDLVGIRGTRLAYELFFGSLGYNIKLEQFWYDDVGNLIEINPYNETTSTFYAYNQFGIAIDDPQIPRDDPRRLRSAENSILQNNKTNFLRAVLSPKNTSIATSPANFSPAKKRVVRAYLEYLRPLHMQYIQEIIAADLAEDVAPTVDDSLGISTLIELFFTPDIIDFSAYDERFIVGIFRELKEDLSYQLRWDSSVKWDSGLKWDQKVFLTESFSIA